MGSGEGGRATSLAEPAEAASSPGEHSLPAVPRFVVAIGASAGGLEALTRLLSHVGRGLPAAIVVVQHLSASHRSLLTQLLGRETPMQVEEAAPDTEPVAGVVYVAPAKHDLRLADGRFHLTAVDPGAVPHPSVNVFMHSIAQAFGERAVGIILSGTGSDGASGMRAIKAAGGFTFAQDLSTARHPGMPQAAADTGVVDWVLTPEQIAQRLDAVIGSGENPPELTARPPHRDAMARLLAAVRQQTHIDFSGYRDTTLRRRLARRIAATHCDSFEEYVARATTEPAELDRFAKDVLISVTSFFRDPVAFDALRRILVEMVARKAHGDELRIWVPGCATGEEAYSIAMLLADAAGATARGLRVQIFATDLDVDALALARRGMYSRAALPARVEKMLGERLVERGENVEVAKAIREMVVFARQDVVQDPPFLRLDLVSCRNLLIYFQPDLQKRVLDTFAYALNPGGHLLLGKSESLGAGNDRFEPVDRAVRLFRRTGRPSSRLDRRAGVFDGGVLAPSRESSASDALGRQFAEAALERYTPPGLLVNRDGDILYTFAKAGHFLTVPEGRVRLTLANALLPELRAEAQVLLHRAIKRRETCRGHPRSGKVGPVRLAIHPAGTDENTYLVAFEPVAPAIRPAARTGADENPDVKAMEDELISTREHLQTVVEELESSNEEMQALNEELQSANEEMQSTNEELETSNEELQSANEELSTVNDELQAKATALADAKDDLETALASLPDPLLVVDANLFVARYNESAARLFRLPPHPGAVVFRVGELAGPVDSAELAVEVARVMQTGAPYETTLELETGTFILRIAASRPEVLPARGAVVSFTDTSVLTQAQKALQESERRLEAIMRSSLAAVSVRDVAGRIEYVNPCFEALYEVTIGDVTGRTDVEVFPGELGIAAADAHAMMLASRRPVEIEEDLALPAGSRRLLTLRFPLIDAEGRIFAVCTKSVDVTARHAAEQAVRAGRNVLQSILNSLEAHIAVVDRDGVIQTVNQSWRRFAASNGAREEAAYFVGDNYLEVCRRSGAAGDSAATQVANGLESVLSGGRQTFRLEYPCHGPDEERWFLVEISALDANGGGAVIAHSPVTARKLAESEAARLREELEQRMAMRLRELDSYNLELESFAYSVSHDLKTPLRAISGFGALLLDECGDQIDKRGRQYLHRISESTRRMSKLIDDLLQLSRFARAELHLERVDLTAMAREVAEELRSLAPARIVEILIADGLEAQSDPRLMRVVLDNLVGNAWKYSGRRARARIEVGRTLHNDTPAFFVRDNGEGFDMAFYDKLFLPFQRLHDPEDFPGNGIGLANVQRIIQRHGGRVWADSTVGYGSTFYFTLPPRAAEA
jgi:two-component system CheB/CheR fusion protein